MGSEKTSERASGGEMPKGKARKMPMKRAFSLFWHGLVAMLSGIANWLTVLLGMRDDSKYGKFLRRTVGSCFAFMMLVLAIVVGANFCRWVWSSLRWNFGDSRFTASDISRSVTYFTAYGEDGYLKTSDGTKTITGIKWIAKPLGRDSLACYSDGKKRGYFNMYTGQPVVKPVYDHAWVFSEGLAAVDDGGWVKFIDTAGDVAIDPKLPCIPDGDGYVFHNGCCVVNNDRLDRLGMIDRKGNWLLEPEYFSIAPSGKFWIVDRGNEESLLDSALNTVIPFLGGNIFVCDGYVSVTLDNHALQRYDFDGKLVNDFCITDVTTLTYPTDEVYFSTTESYDAESSLSSETTNWPSFVEKPARCLQYEAAPGWYGLMAADGRVVTPPSYIEIEAHGYDLYFCKKNMDDGVMLNSEGDTIR